MGTGDRRDVRGVLRCWLLPVLLFAGLLAVRVPFLDQTLVGEEGGHAYLAVDNGRPLAAGPGDALLVGRVGEADLFCPPEHPILPYALLRALRPLSGDGMDFGSVPLGERSRRARLPFFLLSAIAIGLLALGLAHGARAGDSSWLPHALVAFVGTTPLLVGGSMQAQVDGSFGVLLVQVSATCMVLAAGTRARLASTLLLVAGGAVAGAGKNEWSLAFLGGLAAAFVIAWVFGRPVSDAPTERRPPWRALLWLLGGLAGGCLGSFLLDPANYLGGLDVMQRIHRSGQDWSHTFTMRLPAVWPLALLIALAAVAAWQQRRDFASRRFPHAVLLCWGVAMTLGFGMTSWYGDGLPRYFCPPAFALLTFVVTTWPRVRLARGVSAVLVVGLATGTAVNVVTLLREHRHGRSVTSSPGLRLADLEERWRAVQERTSSGQPGTADSSFGYYFHESSFVSSEIGPETASRLIEAAGRARPR